jgi:hypothetical protein
LTSLSRDPLRDVELARYITELARTYAADNAGIQCYTADLAAWNSQNGNNPSPDHTTYPLSPGTVPAGSKECFRCGQLTVPPHFGQQACIAQNGQELPRREQNLRNLVGTIMHPPGQRTAGISQITEVPYDPFGGYDADELLYEDFGESENGEEPAV